MLCIIASHQPFGRSTACGARTQGRHAHRGRICARLTAADEQLGLSSLDYIPVMRAAAETERFRDTRLFAFESRNDEAKQMQFAAVSFLLPDGSVFIAYRGTDTSLVGWKENFNMSYLETVPAQARATEYAQEVIRACKHRPYRIGGHSKGGNLAAWAAVHLPKLQGKRLLAAYNNDGPGFHADLLDTPAYRRVEDRLHTYIPESSIVGVLLVHAEDYDVIDSTSHAAAAMQHEALSWQVMGTGLCIWASAPSWGRCPTTCCGSGWTPCLRRTGEAFLRRPVQHPLHGWPCQGTFEDLRKGGLSGWAALWKEYAGADERKKQILTEVFGRLAIDVKDELMKAAGRACGPPDTASGRWDRTSWAAVNRIKHRQK